MTLDANSADRRAWTAQIRFGERGVYDFRISAYEGEQLLETYEKEIAVEALMPEGSRLELDEGALRDLAERSGGRYVSEEGAQKLGEAFAATLGETTVAKEMPLAQTGPYFILLVMGLLVVEWWLRRRSNLV